MSKEEFKADRQEQPGDPDSSTLSDRAGLQPSEDVPHVHTEEDDEAEGGQLMSLELVKECPEPELPDGPVDDGNEDAGEPCDSMFPCHVKAGQRAVDRSCVRQERSLMKDDLPPAIRARPDGTAQGALLSSVRERLDTPICNKHHR